MKIKLTKGELKYQRDALRQYRRYLPTLQLKKQQLQMEILRQISLLEEKKRSRAARLASAQTWAGLLAEDIAIKPYLVPREIANPEGGRFPGPKYPKFLRNFWVPREVVCGVKNIAGVDLPVFERIVFDAAEYDLFTVPLWVDAAVEALRILVGLREEIRVLEEALEILRHELRITTQRVNLFEKVKIPEAEEAVRRIKIYIGDQMANAVGRSKIAKRKIEAALVSV